MNHTLSQDDAPATPHRVDAITAEERRKMMARLARIEGQLRGVQRMIAAGDSCERVAQQLSAARGGLDKAFAVLVACAIESELRGDSEGTSELHERVQHLTGLLARYG